MHFVFMHPTGNGYHPGSPLTKPLGGTESAVVYLSTALVRAGAKVTLLNNPKDEAVIDGVHLLPSDKVPPGLINQCDVLVVITTAVGSRIRASFNHEVPMVLWCHLDVDLPFIAGLRQPDEREAWNGYVMVSQWQAQRFISHFGLDAARTHVIGNAVSPAFLDQPASPAWFETGASPTLFYSSTPFRGLDVLLQCFPSIRARVPDVRLKIHSSMGIYGLGQERDGYRYLYELARNLPGVDYIGPVSQPDLAVSLQSAAALAYPATFDETSCIAVMEALASGADVLTTDRGALPETLHGFGCMLKSDALKSPYAINNLMANAFIDMVVHTLEDARQNPAAAAAKRKARMAFVRENYTWDVRAQQWLALGQQLARRKPTPR
ncbi:glycosyltransferase involved in cell wall biosynthesis [Agrobacterium vitis]|nr:glycosyltransferase involved in cell wall biosynthesis [Agrobacterium vitis]MBE1440061.1 glycosyltransferase involved in cell wall biosynthesis [Agrobacterium vitis]